MKLNKVSLALSVAGAVVLSGCGGGSSSSSDSGSSGSSTYSVKAIDGYLKGALVWLDIDGDFVLDDNEPSATSGDGGVANLDVSNVSNPGQYAVVVKAIPGQTIDEDNGPVSTGYVMSAPAGETNVTPLSTLVHVTLKQTTDDDATEEEIEQAKQDAVDKIAADLGIDPDDVLGDFIEEDLDDAAFAAETLVEQDVLPDDEEDLGDAAEGTDDTLLESANTVSSSIKTVNETDPEDYDTIDLDTDTDGDGVPDLLDAFDDDPNEQYDLDGDGTGDNSDLDKDGDGVNNDVDAFPTNASESADFDKDKIGDNADLDDDNDGVKDTDDDYPNDNTRAGDSDGDGTDDLYDEFPDDPELVGDSDGDGVDSATDQYPGDPTRAGDSDGDGVDDLDDEFPDDNTQAGDADGDGVDGLQDAFPGDASESVDTDSDGIGNNADDDDDGDGVIDSLDSDPLDDQVGATDNAKVSSALYGESYAFIFDADIEDNEVTIETMEIDNGIANLVSIAEVNSFGMFEFELGEDSDVVLTSTGWTQLDGQYSLDFSGGSEIIAYATNYPQIVSYSVSAVLTDLEGTVVSTLLTEEEVWDQFEDSSLAFSMGAFMIEAVLTPEEDLYRLYDGDSAWIFKGDGGMSDGEATSLDELTVTTSVGEQVSTGSFVGAYLSGNDGMAAAVELLENNTANFYTMDWENRDPNTFDTYATKVATGTWSDGGVTSVELIELTVPQEALTAWGELWDEGSTTVLFTVYDGVVVRGSVEKADVALDDDDLVFISKTAKDDILDAIKLPFGECYANNAESGATESDFLLAIAGCGGLESKITSEMVVGNTFERFSGDDSSRQYTFVEGGTVHVGKDGIYAFDAQWAIEETTGYLVITDEDGGVWKWALVGKETGSSSDSVSAPLTGYAIAEEGEVDKVWSVKHFETYTDDAGVSVSEIWSETYELVDKAVCPFGEMESGATEQDFDNAITAYQTCTGSTLMASNDDVSGKTILRTNSRGEMRANMYNGDGSGSSYRNGVYTGDFAWSIVDGQKIQVTDPNNTSMVYEQYVIAQRGEDSYQMVVFEPEEGAYWADEYIDSSMENVQECQTGNTEWDEVNDVPLTTATFEEYLEAIDECKSDLAEEVWFSNEFFDRDDRQIVISQTGMDADEKYTFNSDGSGFYTDLGEEPSVDYNFTWTADSENKLLVVTITAGELTAIDYMAIVGTDGKLLSVKALSKANETGWPGIGEDDEGDLWSHVYMIEQVFPEE
ncbi:thrombospondin type 3 repeat-containing protein [Vibrio sinaloensis]|uniref:ATPase AAA n=1 Tax=Photobacterium sp. (strain ATCC 43367) TaxID=379097 RepID=A0A0A5I0Z1_PHOS4|nr:thrombospondin type 3 repeat-containing protein [Vibrio sinaloensis]KGY09439.1 ATPase AAA [Vibrio sinaloensis]